VADEPILKICAKCKEAKPLSEYLMRGDRGGRQVPRSQCKECMKKERAKRSPELAAKTAKWRKDDPERARESVRNCYHKHKSERNAYDRERWQDPARREPSLERNKIWKKNHPENVKASRAKIAPRLKVYYKKYNQDHPDQCAEYRNRRRALICEAGGDYTAEDIADIRRMQKDKCAYFAYCHTHLKGKGAVDHIVALSKGGTNDRRNLQLLCKSCNSKKHATDAIDFIQSRGGLI
jgi:5-methylcytosine-specific restriction endonuclease McrA